MSAIRTHRLAELETLKMAEKRADRIAGLYGDKVLAPLKKRVEAVNATGDDRADAQRLLETLDAGLLGEFDNDALAADLEAHLAQTTAIGAATGPDVGRDEGTEGRRLMNAVSALTTSDFNPGGLKEARRIFERKAPLPADRFNALTTEQRSLAFNAWRVNQAKLIQRVRNMIRDVLSGDRTYRDLRNDLVKLLDLDGLDPGVLNRIRTLYRQNALSAYSTARRAVLEEPVVKDAFPFWRYMTVGDGTVGRYGVRESHAELHGKVFRADDPVWQVIYPPWGWGCRCFVIPMTAEMVEADGLKVESTGRTLVAPEPTIRSPSVLFDRESFDQSNLDPDLRTALERLQSELKRAA